MHMSTHTHIYTAGLEHKAAIVSALYVECLQGRDLRGRRERSWGFWERQQQQFTNDLLRAVGIVLGVFQKHLLTTYCVL